MADQKHGSKRPGVPGLDTPGRGVRRGLPPRFGLPNDAFGKGAEAFARFMGTPQFLIGMTIVCVVWVAWNTLAPESMQFDPRSLNFTLLTLILSLQASYAAPLILLAENRSADRDRVEAESDRQRAERNLADTEFLTREVASLRITMRDIATRDFIRSELRNLLEEIEEQREDEKKDVKKRAQKTARQTAKKVVAQSAEQQPEDRPSEARNE